MNLAIGKIAYRIFFGKRSNVNTICRVLAKRGLIEIIPWLPVEGKKRWALRIHNKEKGEYAYLFFDHAGREKPTMDDCLDSLRMSLEVDWEMLA